MPGWDGIHKYANHWLAVCFDTEKAKIIREYQVTSALEVLPVLMEIVDEAVVLFFVWKKPGPVGSFIEDLIRILLVLPTEYRIFFIGDLTQINYCTKIY